MLFYNIQVVTDAFEKLATSVQSTSKLRTDLNLIQSTQTIEEFAFKYASFNLNASNTDERKENKHIGKKICKFNVVVYNNYYVQNLVKTYLGTAGSYIVFLITFESFLVVFGLLQQILRSLSNSYLKRSYRHLLFDLNT